DTFLFFGFLVLRLDRNLLHTLHTRAINVNTASSAYARDLIRTNLERENNQEEVKQLWRTLTNRQRQVSFLIFQGLTYQEIGDKLYLSRRTIRGYARDLMKLFGVRGKLNLRAVLALLPEEYLNIRVDVDSLT
ncbi:unnamed protein product, partial [marine sediment metagenome]